MLKNRRFRAIIEREHFAFTCNLIRMNDPVRDYLQSRGYANYIVEGGVDYLLASWESMVQSVEDGEVLDFNQYVKAMDRRRILEEAIERVPLYQQVWYHRRMYDADALLRSHLVFTDVPICGPALAAEKGYTPDGHWWYYHRPRAVDRTWPELA